MIPIIQIYVSIISPSFPKLSFGKNVVRIPNTITIAEAANWAINLIFADKPLASSIIPTTNINVDAMINAIFIADLSKNIKIPEITLK
jgi:hypothetical protein